MCKYKKGANNTVVELPPNAGIVQTWLNEHQEIAEYIRWRVDGFFSYNNWHQEQKAELENYFNLIADGQALDLDDRPKIHFPKDDFSIANTTLEKDLAWKYYLAHIAQALYVEIELQEERGDINWSIQSYPEELKIALFDSSSFISWNQNLRTCVYDKNIHGAVTPGDPFKAYQFLLTENLLVADQLETIKNLIDWSKRLAHMSQPFGSSYGTWSVKMNLDHWQYAGLPPLQAVIDGTRRGEETETKHWTAGCWGTVGFYKAVLRTVNIPVKVEIKGTKRHALPNFLAVDQFLSHGDDPYATNLVRVLGIPGPNPINGDGLLITKEEFDDWFGSDDLELQSKNIGRGVDEAIIELLPIQLLQLRCRETTNDHAQSQVYKVFQNSVYSAEELENLGLWTRIEAEINSRGGCNVVDPP